MRSFVFGGVAALALAFMPASAKAQGVDVYVGPSLSSYYYAPPVYTYSFAPGYTYPLYYSSFYVGPRYGWGWGRHDWDRGWDRGDWEHRGGWEHDHGRHGHHRR
jgi:hypothetical protein